MARPRKRICLQDGLRLELNELIRSRMVIPGERTSQPIVWSSVGKPGRVAWGLIDADLRDRKCAQIRILMVPSVDQTIDLVAQERNFGGVQWYFRCPVRGTRASILWKLPGAKEFCSRQSLDGRAAYHSQFVGEGRRAQIGKGEFGPDWAATATARAIGICRRPSQNGCGGRPTGAISINITSTTGPYSMHWLDLAPA